ncbi:MAG: sigma-54-dependent Fis family transcriptional regulator, partial [Alphaproteobacteria bacterium]|nr:sigma-54-dependent Fis family transcriptional regulator [Alphaproteobacteria bacterium]
MSQSVLIIDDEEDIRRLVSDILGDEGYETYTAADGASAMETIKVRRPSLVILDIWLNDSRFDGIELLDIIKSDHPLAPVIMISGHGTIETAVKSIQKGAYDFVEKPFTAERLLLVVKRALEASRLVRENIELRDRVGEDEFVGESSAATQLRSTIETVAPTKSRV